MPVFCWRRRGFWHSNEAKSREPHLALVGDTLIIILRLGLYGLIIRWEVICQSGQGPTFTYWTCLGPAGHGGRHSSPGISPPDRSRQLSCLLGLPSRQAGYVPYRQRVSRAVGSPVPQPPCLVSPRLGRTVGTHGARTQRAACARTSLFLERADWQKRLADSR